jgi:hypothetical protein
LVSFHFLYFCYFFFYFHQLILYYLPTISLNNLRTLLLNNIHNRLRTFLFIRTILMNIRFINFRSIISKSTTTLLANLIQISYQFLKTIIHKITRKPFNRLNKCWLIHGNTREIMHHGGMCLKLIDSHHGTWPLRWIW